LPLTLPLEPLKTGIGICKLLGLAHAKLENSNLLLTLLRKWHKKKLILDLFGNINLLLQQLKIMDMKMSLQEQVWVIYSGITLEKMEIETYKRVYLQLMR
jgi:hypothetical protein